MMQNDSIFTNKIILMKLTYPEIFMKIRHDDVILQLVTSFSYIFPYYDVIDKNADIFCSHPIKGILNKYQTEFVYKLIKKQRKQNGGPIPLPTQPPNRPPEVGLMVYAFIFFSAAIATLCRLVCQSVSPLPTQPPNSPPEVGLIWCMHLSFLVRRQPHYIDWSVSQSVIGGGTEKSISLFFFYLQTNLQCDQRHTTLALLVYLQAIALMGGGSPTTLFIYRK